MLKDSSKDANDPPRWVLTVLIGILNTRNCWVHREQGQLRTQPTKQRF